MALYENMTDRKSRQSPEFTACTFKPILKFLIVKLIKQSTIFFNLKKKKFLAF